MSTLLQLKASNATGIVRKLKEKPSLPKTCTQLDEHCPMARAGNMHSWQANAAPGHAEPRQALLDLARQLQENGAQRPNFRVNFEKQVTFFSFEVL